MMANVRKKAREFTKALNGDFSAKAISAYLTKLGVSIAEIDASGYEVINRLHLTGLIARNGAVTYQNSGGYVVFLNLHATACEKQTALLREAGHILLEHKSAEGVVGNTLFMQKEADAFVRHALRAVSPFSKILPWVVAAALLCVLSASAWLVITQQTKDASSAPPAFVDALEIEDFAEDETAQAEEGQAAVGQAENAEQNAAVKVQEPNSIVYITKSGKKYHCKNCRHITGRNVSALSLREAIRANYTPCADCMK